MPGTWTFKQVACLKTSAGHLRSVDALPYHHQERLFYPISTTLHKPCSFHTYPTKRACHQMAGSWRNWFSVLDDLEMDQVEIVIPIIQAIQTEVIPLAKAIV